MISFKPLRDIITFKGGGTPSKQVVEYWDGNIPWATVKDFTSTSLSATQDFITHEGLKNSAANLIPKGHVIIPTRMSLGKAAINKIDLAINQDLRALVPKVPLDARFLLHAVLSLKDEIIKKGFGATVKGITQDELYKLEIAFPPLDDQIRISHLLDKTEGLIAQRKQHLRQLDDLLTSVFLELFGDPVRNEKRWDIQPCEKAVLDISSGTSYGGEDRAFISLDEVGVLKISAVTKGTFDPTEFKVVNPAQITKTLRFVKRGDFLFSRANTVELVAACCVVPQHYTQLFLPDKLWVLTLNPELVNSQFFNYLLKNKRYRDVVRSLASGGHASMLNISMKKFMTLGIPCPGIDLQDQFSLIVEKVERVKSRYKQSLNDLESLYGALSQKALKGELDLSRVPLSEIKPEEETAVVTAPLQARDEESLAINLPNTDNLLEALENAEARDTLITQWLMAYHDQLGNTPFSVHRFMAAAQTRLAELHPDTNFELGASDYEHIKAWVFKTLAAGKLAQAFDDDSNRIQLKAVQA
jgi:type I restriction enzyme, S subunit